MNEPTNFFCRRHYHEVSPTSVHVNFGDHVFIETYIGMCPPNVYLSDIPKSLHLRKSHYRLRGIISNRPVSSAVDDIYQYVAYCHRPHGWEIYDNNNNCIMVAIRSDLKVVCDVLLYTL